MATQKQLEANRRNARRSTGPQSEAGKAIVAANALKTGLHASRFLVLESLGESAADYEAHAAAVVASLAPVGPLEETTAANIASLLWRIRRIPQLEAAASLPAVDLPTHPDLVEPSCSVTLERPPATAPARDRLARVRDDLRCGTNRRAALAAALTRLDSRLRPRKSDGEYGIPEAKELREAVSEVLGWPALDFGKWIELARELSPPADLEQSPRWTAPLLVRAFDRLATDTNRTPLAFRRAVRKQLKAMLAHQDELRVEREHQERGLVQEMKAERDRAHAVAVYGSEKAVTGIQKSEQHLTKQLERNLLLLERLQARRSQAEEQSRRDDTLRLGGYERQEIGFVFRSALPFNPSVSDASFACDALPAPALEATPAPQPANEPASTFPDAVQPNRPKSFEPLLL